METVVYRKELNKEIHEAYRISTSQHRPGSLSTEAYATKIYIESSEFHSSIITIDQISFVSIWVHKNFMYAQKEY